MRIIAAGTFDHLHEGHKYFLQEAFGRGFVMIGLSADSMLDHKEAADRILCYQKRKNELVRWLAGEGYIYGKDYIIIKIRDEYGFADDIKDIDAILVTSDVKKNAEKINEVRKSKNWRELSIVEVPLVADERGIISSTRVRKSE